MTNNGDGKKVKFHIHIDVFEDGTTKVDAPRDFLLFRDIMNSAERTIIAATIQAIQHEQQQRILRPVLKGVGPMTGRN